jgi:Dickkopf N-terminal cysteine-rich region
MFIDQNGGNLDDGAGVSEGVKRGWRWFVLLVAFGCSSDPPQQSLEAQQFPIAFVRAGCAHADVCCAARLGSTSSADARARCEAMDEFSAALMGDLDAAVRAGRVTYNAEIAERCLQMIATSTCDVRIDITRADIANGECAQAVHGLVSVGGVCESSWDCAPGLFCDAIPLATPRCVSRRPIGAPCASEAQCQSGRCVHHTCVERLPVCSWL